MTTPKLLMPTGADELWVGPRSSLAFAQKNPGAGSVNTPMKLASDGEGTWIACYGTLSTAEPWIATSTDNGVTWSAQDTGLSVAGQPWWDGRRFVVAKIGGPPFRAAVSEDGLTWTVTGMFISTAPVYLVHIGDRWVYGDGSFPNRIYISDGPDVEGPYSTGPISYGAGVQQLRENDGVSLMVWDNDTNTNMHWLDILTLAEGDGILVGSGHPTWMRFGPLGGAWFAGSSIVGDYFTSADGKTWTSATDAALTGLTTRDAYWDGTVWWVTADDGVDQHLLEFDPAGPTWTDHPDKPNAGEIAVAIEGQPLIRHAFLGGIDDDLDLIMDGPGMDQQLAYPDDDLVMEGSNLVQLPTHLSAIVKAFPPS